MPPPFAGGFIAPALLTRKNEAPLDDIFLRSVSPFYNKHVDGNNFTVSAPTRVANDQLFFVKFGDSMVNPGTPAGWIAYAALPSSFIRLYHRLATNTSADNFAVGVESSARNVMGQMAVFGNTLGEIVELVEYQAGTQLTDQAGTTWNLGALAEDLTPEANNLVLSYYFRERSFSVLDAPSLTISAPIYLANNIGSIAYKQYTPAGTDGDIWFGWDWESEVSNSPAKPLTEIIYTPVRNLTANYSRSQRMRYE